MKMIVRYAAALALRGSVAALAFAGLTPTAVAQVLFHEDFQIYTDPDGNSDVRCSGAGGPGTYFFPSGWLLRNVDNRVPNPQVNYVNDAWEVREDFAGSVTNCAAFSTSWYNPVGSANDWMWTPLIGPIPTLGSTTLSWRARTYDPDYRDGYEVRVMVAPSVPSGGTGVIGNQITNSTVVYSTGAEETSWVTRTVSLSGFGGQSVYIGFRNNSNDKFLLLVDDVDVARQFDHDPALNLLRDATPTAGYARVPAFLAYPFDLAAGAQNRGIQPLTDMLVMADVLVDGAPMQSLESALFPLAAGAAADVPIGGGTYGAIGTWSVAATIGAAEGDDVPENSSLTQALVEVTEDELTRSDGSILSMIGIGSGLGGEIAQDFEIPAQAAVSGLRMYVNNVDDPPDGVGDFNGYMMEATLRAWDADMGRPGAALHTASFTVPPDAPIGELVLEFPIPNLALPPGRYAAGLLEPTAPAPRTLTLFQTEGRYTPGTLWVTWPTSPFGDWAAIEAFPASFHHAAKISVLLRPDAYSVGGTVTGLAGAGLVLQLDGGSDLPIGTDGAFAFPPIDNGSTYDVTVLTQPSNPMQTCTVSNGSGTLSGTDVTDVAVACTTNNYTVGGAVSGLAGEGLVLQLNGSADLPIGADGAFAFPAIDSGSAYEVTVLTQPSAPTQTCTVANGSGTLSGANVTDVVVMCATNNYTVGGAVSGLAGEGLVLQLNGSADLPIGVDGAFAFPAIDSGSAYEVTVLTQPSNPMQTCTVSNGSGTLNGTDVTDVVVMCATNSYTIGGTVTGLEGTLVLQVNGFADLVLTADGPFTFATLVASGQTYAVTVLSDPANQTCTPTNASGVIGDSNVVDVILSCGTDIDDMIFADGFEP
jgi:hypothetical protein